MALSVSKLGRLKAADMFENPIQTFPMAGIMTFPNNKVWAGCFLPYSMHNIPRTYNKS